MRNKTILFLCIMLSFASISCKKENNIQEPVKENPRFVYDQYGRVLILHGLNMAGSSKRDILTDSLTYLHHYPWTSETFVDREAKDYGFNAVRYLVFWEGIEPFKDDFRQEYLDSTAKFIDWYTSRGMYVIFDMHQDIYGPLVYGNGAPKWATITNGQNPSTNVPGQLWWLQNLHPGVINAYQNFFQYTNHKYLQDHYILSFKKLVEHFKDNPYVIGYDLMNEPHGGDLVKTLFGDFEKNQLAPFYNRLIKGIREVDNEKWIFFEPRSFGVNFGLESFLPKINDQRAGMPRMQYAPHCYPIFMELNKYDGSSKKQILDWETRRITELKKQGTGILIGEFGFDPNWPGRDNYFKDFFEMSDRNMSNWTYWSSDPGGWGPWNPDLTESPIMNNLIRVYPRAIAGEPVSFNYNKASNIFNFVYKNNPAINQPTEIFIPPRFFPNGYEFTVTGTSDYTDSYDATFHVVKISSSYNGEIKILIKPK